MKKKEALENDRLKLNLEKANVTVSEHIARDWLSMREVYLCAICSFVEKTNCLLL